MSKDKAKPKCEKCGVHLRMHAPSGNYYCANTSCALFGDFVPPKSSLVLLPSLVYGEGELLRIKERHPMLRG